MLNTAPNYVQEYLWNVLHLAVASRSEKCVVFLMDTEGQLLWMQKAAEKSMIVFVL